MPRTAEYDVLKSTFFHYLCSMRATHITPDESLRLHLISDTAQLSDALSHMNALGPKPHTLFVINNNDIPLGSLTDGDLRRALLSGMTQSASVTAAMNVNFMAIRTPQDAPAVIRQARKVNILMLPLLNSDGTIKRLLNLSMTHSILPLDAVLMAGGRGERLMPLTANCPKPLLRVGDRAIIDYNVEKLRENGISSVHLCLNYLHEMIEQHFRDTHPDMTVSVTVERKRMGTFGALSLISDWKHDNILVMNADLLSSLDLEQMYLHHINTGADATMAVSEYTVAVPFAIIQTEGNFVMGMKEKPVYNYFANAGVYIIKKSMLERMVHDTYVDAPDFLQDAIANGASVAYFPIGGTWIDIGTPEQYARACEFARSIASQLRPNLT